VDVNESQSKVHCFQNFWSIAGFRTLFGSYSFERRTIARRHHL